MTEPVAVPLLTSALTYTSRLPEEHFPPVEAAPAEANEQSERTGQRRGTVYPKYPTKMALH
jgi:hypothetical protein